MNKLLSYLTPDMQEIKHLKEITAAESPEFNKLEVDLVDLNNQFFIDTATWGLSVYEKELGLTVEPNKTLQERRSIIKAKWRGIGKVDAEMIKAIVKAFTNSNVEVGFDGRINIIFSNEKTIKLNISDMFNAIEEVKPAHLNYDFTSQHSVDLQLETNYKEYPISYPMCGTFLCGTKPYIQTEGISFNTQLNANTNKTDTSQRYKLTGTFKSGEAKL